jgi:hypothetical protein
MADRSLRFSSWIVGGPRETPRVTSFSAATASIKTITYPKPLPIADVEAEGTASPRIRIPTSRTRSCFTAFTLLVRKATT